MGAKFWNADSQRSDAAFRKIDAGVKSAIEEMISFAENWKEADHVRLHAVKSKHKIEEALQKMIDLSDTKKKAEDTLAVACKLGKKKDEAFAKLKTFQDKSAAKTEERVNKVKGALRSLNPFA